MPTMRSSAKETRRQLLWNTGLLLSTGAMMVTGVVLFRGEQGNEKVYSEAAILFDLCGFSTQPACTADATCTPWGV